jgi:hypothetical protein
MTSIPAPGSSASATNPDLAVSPQALSKTRVAATLAITLFVALAVYYVIGVDEGMTSVFGKTLAIHEWVHDARHFLGFPCH